MKSIHAIRLRIIWILLLLVPVLSHAENAPAAETVTKEWNFRVYLDESEIGYHRFSLTESGDLLEVTTEADFRVRFLFITAYEYSHVNRETWRAGCLEAMRSSTDANGRKSSVVGQLGDGGFAVEASGERREAAGCVKSFAYWNPRFLEAPALLNAQTGELMPVLVEEVAIEPLEVRGETVPAQRFRLTARDLELDIWYSEDDRWLALQSTVSGGRKLRYELS
ncbi:MAG: DUF6134 family protein [Gammaproteobacteria bacterium]|nr:DUF6134 family protein [Gammaproteobacteria bacterium]MDH5344396.1 DUF6134 family protein [Gammaproteobacteria bacterium]